MRGDLVKSSERTIFRPGHNCWRVDLFRHATVLIDCADFYRALHYAFSKAQKSVFIIGWEVDSSIRLLRKEDEMKASRPSILVDLLAQKAQENPHLQIYILPWDSSIVFLGEREFMGEYTWANKGLENIHFCLDQTIPLGGSHHQKVILVDDEIVFSGGMDIARQRWDERSHHIYEPERSDANGPYGPYHDVQIMMDGPIVKHFAELARHRWLQAAGYEALPYEGKSGNSSHLSQVWPIQFDFSFTDMGAAVARPLPATEEDAGSREVFNMYIDLINQAKDFIYIENQFLTSQEIAVALNDRLRREKNLRVLLVSSYDPQGVFETEGMWASRIDFKRSVEDGIAKGRVQFACSGVMNEKRKIIHKRIHSKVLVIDDQFMVVGSSNLTNRSMTFDSECDLIIQAHDTEERRRILHFRNDLIAEHAGRKIEDIETILKEPYSFKKLMLPCQPGTYCLFEMDDEQFTTQNFKKIANSVADPQVSEGKALFIFRNPSKYIVPLALFLIVIVSGLVWFINEHMSWFSPESVERFLRTARKSPWALFLVWGIYIVGGFILFPVTLMSLITAAVFGSILGPLYGMSGALISATIMFYLGRWMGHRGLKGFLGNRLRKMDHQFREAGVIGVTVLRMIPVAPFSIVNIAAGISSLRFSDFLIGSFFGFLPAFIVKGLVGDSITQIFLHPTPHTVAMLALGILLWMLLVVASYFLTRWWRKRKQYDS
ncbi:hypothetical protein AZI85_06385 [Bdellovibrio bacteriovorus]|uniref:PLD phosphodiesterase domain-containing protein n=1 Tax=Bdellovibrio bacteriovorus TaxID=959 RepID=A0A150WFS4_BDEBC|nr:VTT domain-containing protein [Bdellovibrio bacteriovorus]KYG61842.1 hypothetical protein AZI85_06385 [Bdellovibrio bacteriovorus]